MHTPLPDYKYHVLTRKSAGELRYRGPKCGDSALVYLSSLSLCTQGLRANDLCLPPAKGHGPMAPTVQPP
jgi:hypothetical protein